MGITFLAAGTSVPEAVSSVIVAKQGKFSKCTLLNVSCANWHYLKARARVQFACIMLLSLFQLI